MSDVMQDVVRNRLLRALPEEDFDAFRSIMEHVELDLRTALTEPGRRIEYVHFLEAGIASVVIASSDNEAVEVGHIGREGVAGSAIFLGVPVAETRTFMQVAGSAWRIRTADVDRLLERRPATHALFLRYVHTQQMQLSYSALANARYSLRECLARWLLMSQDRVEDDELPLTHEFLSLMLGVRRAGVTGELHILEGMNIIKATRGIVRVLDRQRLRDVAGGCYGAPEAVYDRLIRHA